MVFQLMVELLYRLGEVIFFIKIREMIDVRF